MIHRYYAAVSPALSSGQLLILSDEAQKDSGSNFGRVARGKIMEPFIEQMNRQAVAGIPLFAWQRFFRIFTDTRTEDAVLRGISAIPVVDPDPGETAA